MSPTTPRHVAIIGAGIIGILCAIELLERGHRVSLIDPEPLGGASRVAAGMLAVADEYYFREEALLALTRPSLTRWAELRAARRLDRFFAPEGILTLGVDAADRAELMRLRNAGAAFGLSTQALSVSQARERETALPVSLSAAFLSEHDTALDPRGLARELLDHARLNPNFTLIAQRALALERTMADDGATADRERYRGIRLGDDSLVPADEVVVAAGVATPQITGWPIQTVLPVRPVLGDILRIRLIPDVRALPQQTIRARVHGRSVYLVPRPENSEYGPHLVLGATSREDSQPLPSVAGIHELLSDAYQVFPPILGGSVLEMSVGARPNTPDNAPLLGRVAPGLILATGFYRHGVLMAPQSAHVVAELIEAPERTRELSEHYRLAAFDPQRFSQQKRKREKSAP